LRSPPVAAIDQAEFDVFSNRQLVDQVEALEHEAQRHRAKAGEFGFIERRKIALAEQIAPCRRAIDRAQRVEQGGFAATRRPHDGYEFARCHVEVDVGQRGRFHFVGNIAALDIL
jgi:hypothetical protein